MDKISIKGVELTKLKIIEHPMGDVFHGLKKSDDGYKGFGEAYFSTIKHKVIKPWKKHVKMTLNLIVPIGEIRFVMHDNRENSETNGQFFEVTLSLKNYCRLTVPPNIWVSFQGIGTTDNLLLNIANLEHDPNEIVRGELDLFAYDWTVY